MRTQLTFLFTLITLISFAQSKFSFGASTGYLFVGDDTGINFKIDGYYHASDRLDVQLAYLTSNIKEAGLDYGPDIISLGLGSALITSDKSKVQSVFGFSYVMFDSELQLDDDNGIGLYFGLNTIYNIGKRFNYGFNTVVTYVRNSPGAILQLNLLLRYRL